MTHCFPWEPNSLILVSEKKNVLLIDTPFTNETTTILMDWIMRTYAPRRSGCIVIGYHMDNLRGVEELPRRGMKVYDLN